MTTPSHSLIAGCQKCPMTSSLNTCSKCKVVQYCGREHQAADWPEHKAICKSIARAKLELEAEQAETAALDAYAAQFTATLPGGTDVDVLLKLARLELKVNNRLAVCKALEHILEMAKTTKSPMLGIADLAPACFLRLGRDQEAYDFMKWWITTPDTIMRAPSQPYTAVTGDNVLEPATIFMGKCPSLAFMATLTLLKLRLLIDLQSLQRSCEQVSGRLPQELVDEVRKNMVSSAITKAIIEQNDHANDIEMLVKDIKTLYQAVKASNKHFWPAVLNPVKDLAAETEGWFYGNEREMQQALKFTYHAWAETPGAIDAIGALSRE